MGSVKRLRDKVYRIVYDVPNTNRKRKQKRETLYNVTKSEAKETVAKRKERAKHRQGLRNPDISVAELFGAFFEIKRRTLSASGFERYEGMFRNYVAPDIGNLKVSDLRPEHLIDAYAKWSAKGRERKAAIRPHRPSPARSYPLRSKLRHPEGMVNTKRRGPFGNRRPAEGSKARADCLE